MGLLDKSARRALLFLFLTLPTTALVAGHPDMNGGGRADLLLQRTWDGSAYTWLMSGHTYLQAKALPYQPGAIWKIVANADMNLDGHSDVIWQHRTSGALYVYYFDGSLRQIGSAPIPNPSSRYWHLVGVADSNEDGHNDLYWQNAISGAVVIWRLNSATSTSTAPSYLASAVVGAPDSSWKVRAVNDINRDGHGDIVWQNSSRTSLIWYMYGTYGNIHNYSQLFSHQVPPTSHWWIRSAADHNSDGNMDLVFQNPYTGQIQFWYMNGETSSSLNMTLTSSGTSTATPPSYWEVRNSRRLP